MHVSSAPKKVGVHSIVCKMRAQVFQQDIETLVYTLIRQRMCSYFFKNHNCLKCFIKTDTYLSPAIVLVPKTFNTKSISTTVVGCHAPKPGPLGSEVRSLSHAWVKSSEIN